MVMKSHLKLHLKSDTQKLDLSDENPQGTAGPVTDPQSLRPRSTHFDLWQATFRHFSSVLVLRLLTVNVAGVAFGGG